MTQTLNGQPAYLLQDAYSEDTLRFAPVGWADDAPLELLLAIGRGEERPRQPLRLEPSMGGDEEADWMWGEPSSIMVISEGLRDLLSRAGITGWDVYPIDLRDWEGRRLYHYHGLAITGRAGARDLKRGELITRPPVGPGMKPYEVRKGFYFDASKWDGSDIVMLAGSLWTVVTDRARRVLEQADTPDIQLTALPEVEIDAVL